MTDEHYYTVDEIKGNFNGPEMVFSDSLFGLFAFAVRKRTRGSYSHFMWRIGPNRVASQWFYFKEFTLDHFSKSTLKFVSNAQWNHQEKTTLLTAILSDLSLPWYSTLYDVPGVIGELLGMNLNLPNSFFCSERGSYLHYVDPLYNLQHPTPTELNQYTKDRGIYKVTGRYSPD